MNGNNSAGVRETRLVHEVHRRATSLLAELLALPTVPVAADELRDFVVEMLEHHHTCEDQDLWPLILARAPSLENPLRVLTDEHDDLQARLDRLEGPGDRRWPAGPRGRPVAATVRDRVSRTSRPRGTRAVPSARPARARQRLGQLLHPRCCIGTPDRPAVPAGVDPRGRTTRRRRAHLPARPRRGTIDDPGQARRRRGRHR